MDAKTVVSPVGDTTMGAVVLMVLPIGVLMVVLVDDDEIVVVPVGETVVRELVLIVVPEVMLIVVGVWVVAGIVVVLVLASRVADVVNVTLVFVEGCIVVGLVVVAGIVVVVLVLGGGGGGGVEGFKA